jgi:hypothetical protein
MLTASTRLGPYEVLAPLDPGGFGQVAFVPKDGVVVG